MQQRIPHTEGISLLLKRTKLFLGKISYGLFVASHSFKLIKCTPVLVLAAVQRLAARPPRLVSALPGEKFGNEFLN